MRKLYLLIILLAFLIPSIAFAGSPKSPTVYGGSPTSPTSADINFNTSTIEGVLETSNGGTGLSTIGSTGQALVVGTSGLEYANVVSEPDGTTSVAKITEETSTNSHGVYPTPAVSITLGETYNLSCFIKAGTASILQASRGGLGFDTATYANFDLSSGTITAEGGAISNCTLQNVGNGIFRVSFSAVATSTRTTSSILINFTNENGSATRSPSYTGTGLNAYVWGAQFTHSSTVSSYIPTTGSSATRTADQLSLSIPAGYSSMELTFDDDSTQVIDVSGSAGSSYTITPSTLTRSHIKTAFIT